MASNKIRGITIEIGGDATKLSKALDEVNAKTRDTQRQLKDVEKLLKLDPGNTELLAQKQTLLSRSIEDSAKKLEELKRIEDQMTAAGIDQNSEQFMALRREIEATTQSAQKASEELEKLGGGSFSKQLSEDFAAAADQASLVAEKTEGISKAAQGALAGLGGLAFGAVSAYGEFEQLSGGVEALFKENADVVKKYADEAYKTAGISANDYLQTVTSFSASLLSALGGNTRAAAEMANIAITDMADNANRFGTDIETVQSAYRGFAKQNYSMLDNLSLGFAGTKQGMEDLLAEAERLTGAKFDINNLSDVIIAIHEVQSSMGITGTTAAEAADTIQGSFASLKASAENLMAGFANPEADVEKLTKALIENGKALGANVAPALKAIWDNIPDLGQTAIKVLGITAALSPVAKAISTVLSALSKLSAIWPKIAAIGSAVVSWAGPWGIAAAAIVAAVVLIVKNWEKLSSWFDTISQKIKDFFANIKPLQDQASGMMAGGAGSSARSTITTNNTYNTYNQRGSSAPMSVSLNLDGRAMASGMAGYNSNYQSLQGVSFVR